MKSTIRKIDRALKQLYNIEHSFSAEKFLIRNPLMPTAGQGALFIQGKSSESLSVGIFLDSDVTQTLAKFPKGEVAAWSLEQLGAFAVASEEVSHFNYFLHHHSQGRAVSQLELEVQGEIDKFLLTFFTNYVNEEVADLTRKFEALIDQFFQHYRLEENLTKEQKQRYKDATKLAQRFLTKYRNHFSDPTKAETVLKLLRRFYRGSLAEKLALSNP